MLAAGYCHLAKLLDRSAVQLHVAARHRCIKLRRCNVAHRVFKLGDEVKLRHGVNARPRLVGRCADVAPESDQHMVADTTGNRASSTLQRHGRAGTAMRNHSREAQVWQAKVVDEVVGSAADQADGDDAVNVFGGQACVSNGFE